MDKKGIDYQRLYAEEIEDKKEWRNRYHSEQIENEKLRERISELYCYKIAYKLGIDVERVQQVKAQAEYRLDCPFWAGSGSRANPWRLLRDKQDIDRQTFERAERLLSTWR